MSRINYRIFLASILSFVFFSFFQSSQAGFFDWFKKFRKNDSQSAAEVVSRVQQDAFYTVSISKSGLGFVTSDDEKINCGEQCAVSYQANSKIVLKAEAGDNYKFERWNGCDKVSGGKCQTTLNKSKIIVAKFVSKNARSSSSSQKSSSSSVGKASSSKSSDFSSKSNSSKPFSSSSSLASKSSSSVSNQQTQNHKTLVVKIVFNKGNGIIKIGDKVCRISECVFEYNLNENLVLQADPDPVSVIDDWGYDCDYVFTPDKNCYLTMNDNKIVVVYFGQSVSGASSSSDPSFFWNLFSSSSSSSLSPFPSSSFPSQSSSSRSSGSSSSENFITSPRTSIPWTIGVLVLDDIDQNSKAVEPLKEAIGFVESFSKFDITYSLAFSSLPHTYTKYDCGEGLQTCVVVNYWDIDGAIVDSLPVADSYIIFWNRNNQPPLQAGSAWGVDSWGILKGGIRRPYATIPVDIWWYNDSPFEGFQRRSAQIISHELINTINAKLEAAPYYCASLTSAWADTAYINESERLKKLTDNCYNKY